VLSPPRLCFCRQVLVHFPVKVDSVVFFFVATICFWVTFSITAEWPLAQLRNYGPRIFGFRFSFFFFAFFDQLRNPFVADLFPLSNTVPSSPPLLVEGAGPLFAAGWHPVCFPLRTSFSRSFYSALACVPFFSPAKFNNLISEPLGPIDPPSWGP